MHVAVMYSGVPGPNGADYMAEMLANGFRDFGARVHMVGRHGGYESFNPANGQPSLKMPNGVDFAVSLCGYNMRPALVNHVRKTCPLFMWTFTDEIGWWRDIIRPASAMVDIHYCYTMSHDYGPHVRLMHIATDPAVYFPQPFGYDDKSRDVDVCMAGSIRTWRGGFCELLARRFKKSVFSWQCSTPTEVLRRLYNRTKVVVAPVQDCDEDVPGRAWGCPCRTFEIRGCGSYQLEVSRKGLSDAYPDADCMPPILDVREAAAAWGDAIAERIANPQRREEQAARDYEHTAKNHLYCYRAMRMVGDFRTMKRGPNL